MLRAAESFDAIHIAIGATDLRKNVDGLTIMIKQSFNLDPFSNSLFLFCNRARNRIKGIIWDKTGFIMIYKRLDGAGARFQWPTDETQVRGITSRQLTLLLDGFSVDPPKGFSEVTARDFY
jgi:transposase